MLTPDTKEAAEVEDGDMLTADMVETAKPTLPDVVLIGQMVELAAVVPVP